ncbi:MAG: EMC3/TMCO1 family protein [Candidatus Methanomethylicia archaeon]|nr:EMC3/TMCO1 family protein [Candidatus Methanomethylicia archaeon]MCX8168965.1 EMC3/TMCO1 family protein [Candidatus Methanomethylicia archaeon]MDW7988697.1 EMC3/TMCO1 family protein [Nitrososphaerota archaeon]
MFDWIVDSLIKLFGPYRDPPLSSLTIIGISIMVCLITMFANYILLDIDELKKKTMEINEWRLQMRKAIISNDRKQVMKLKKREAYIKSLEAEVMAERMKPTLIFIIPLWIFFIIFAAVFNNPEYGYVVVTPFPIPFAGNKLGFGSWYIICSILILPILQKIFKLT